MLITNTDSIPGNKINEVCGMVAGSTVRKKHFGQDIITCLKNFGNKEVREYTDFMKLTRNEATQRLMLQAKKIGANAIINVRYSVSPLSSQSIEVYAYGTAVKIENSQPQDKVQA